MPRSRLPHGLVKPPTQMNRPELFIFALLGTSVAIGLASMSSDSYKVYRNGGGRENDGEGTEQTSSNAGGSACPMNWGKQK
mmetsp:Transcript_26354/g.52936  ORF Transcript_26354/g.52936 Transcript_26354/m.52936 type:complete len:81 (+) Transcript_26354:108-350(+)